MHIGIDLGGTKTEIIALNTQGHTLYRERIPTNRESYEGIIKGIAALVAQAEEKLGAAGTAGICIPGTISAITGKVKNANTVVLNGQDLQKDLQNILGREIMIENDANCLAVSEAVDGAGAGHEVVFAAILGTGCGAGIAINAKPRAGHNLVGGEWGHNPLPWMSAAEYPGPECWCGKRGCLETYISGTGFSEDHGKGMKGAQIVDLARAGDEDAKVAFERYAGRLARALAGVINILDPDIIVLGGGMSNVDELYEIVPPLLPAYVFGGECDTPVVKNRHGDSSGVRGAAWLWRQT